MPWRHSLRARLVAGIGLLAGAAVVAGSAASYAVVQAQLRRQVDDSLLSQPIVHAPVDLLCEPVPDIFGGLLRQQLRMQRVAADGSSCRPDGGSALPVDQQDVQVARTGRGGGLRDVEVDGVHLRLRVGPAAGPGYAVQVARPLTETDTALAQLATFLISGTLLSLLAVTGLSVLVSRRLLGPVDALTGAAEHIAETGDLNVPIEVEGRDEVARLAVAFNRMTARLATSRQRQRQLVADAGHELRTPLTSLRTNVELLARSQDSGRPLDPAVSRRLYANITAQTEELTGLIEKLAELAQDQPADATGAMVRLDDVVRRAHERARLRAGPVRLEVSGLTACELVGDAEALERAVVNLLDNAIKFSPPDGQVALGLVVQHGTAVIEVRDHGPGISAEDLPHVFDRFWRAPESRDLPGSGLGLAIVQQTAERHDGTVTLAPAPGGGTLVRLCLPVPAQGVLASTAEEPDPAAG